MYGTIKQHVMYTVEPVTTYTVQLIDWLTGLLIYAEIDNHGTVVSVRYNAISCGCFEIPLRLQQLRQIKSVTSTRHGELLLLYTFLRDSEF